MAKSTRFADPNEPVQIFQDDAFDNGAPMNSHAPMPAVTKLNRRSLSASNSHVVLQPPSSSGAMLSPHKQRPSSSPQSPLKTSRGNKLNAVSMAPPNGKAPSTDSLLKKPHLSKFKTGHKLSASIFGKENIHPQIFPAPPSTGFSVETSQQLPNGKRGLLDAAHINDTRPGKKLKMNEDEPFLPPHDSFPAIVDDGNKPPHSYAQLIGMAILRSPMRRLTLSQIYKWISDTYSFYGPNDAGWQNSIRHNLSLHKNFIKIERPKDDPGKGNYWGIEPGTELQFLKEKTTRKSAPTAENLPVMSTRLEPSRPRAVPLPQEPTLPPPPPSSHQTLPPLPTSQAMQEELSSDATIPVSDNAAPEESGDRPGGLDSSLELLYSPLPAALHSSPPVARHVEQRVGTPPPAMRNPASSADVSRKRKFAPIDDSGYISSLESSAMRPNQSAVLLTSEADRPRMRRGREVGESVRAEDEILRLRKSSPFSPTVNTPTGTRSRQYDFPPASSSPLRQPRHGQMLPPLTPVVKKRRSLPVPRSASPNTNLRIHRDKVQSMLQSPLRNVTGISDDMVQWSPAFKLDEAAYGLDNQGTNTPEFDIFRDFTFNAFDDNVLQSMSSVEHGSPIRRSAKRIPLDRSLSTSALGDITNSAPRRSITSAPLSKLSGPEHKLLPPDQRLSLLEQSPIQLLETPSKAFEGLSSPYRAISFSPAQVASPSKASGLIEVPATADWAALGMDPNDFAVPIPPDMGDFDGLDILQGFAKIGSDQQKQQAAKGGKPALHRSSSTKF